jgi:hypothetical protein
MMVSVSCNEGDSGYTEIFQEVIHVRYDYIYTNKKEGETGPMKAALTFAGDRIVEVAEITFIDVFTDDGTLIDREDNGVRD